MEINKQKSTVRSSATEAIIDQGLRAYMLKVYNYMASGVLLTGFVAGSAAIDLTFSGNITTDFFAKYVLLHSFAASKSKIGSNASAIGDELSKLMRKRKMRQIS